ncbi:MAG: hypothetical protein M3132_04535 [Actinomycetia bacterium]|nr:hypothetical protein [Actinomycetes bacterium]
MTDSGDGFNETLEENFPGAVSKDSYLASTYQSLSAEGFSRDNTLPCVALCRDEIAGPLVRGVERYWGHTFSLVSLAGMVTAGRTGISAAMAHAPTFAGRQHVVVYAMPHIAIAADGTIGQVERSGLTGTSAACGALSLFRDGLLEGRVDIETDRLDAEQSLLSHRLLTLIPYGDIPGLVELTMLTAQAIEDDLRAIVADLLEIARSQDVSTPDHALFTGVQIHGPDATNYVWPKSAHIVIGGVERDLAHDGVATTPSSTP